MINDKLKKILSALTIKTKSKEALWNKASGENQFRLVLTEGIAVTVSFVEGDQFNHEYYIVSLFNSGGDVIQRYYTNVITDAEDHELVQSFFQAASDAYYRVDETFDALLKSVNTVGTIGTLVEEDSKAIEEEDDNLPF